MGLKCFFRYAISDLLKSTTNPIYPLFYQIQQKTGAEKAEKALVLTMQKFKQKRLNPNCLEVSHNPPKFLQSLIRCLTLFEFEVPKRRLTKMVYPRDVFRFLKNQIWRLGVRCMDR